MYICTYDIIRTYVCMPLRMWACPLMGGLLGIPCEQGGTYMVHNVALLCHLMQQKLIFSNNFIKGSQVNYFVQWDITLVLQVPQY